MDISAESISHDNDTDTFQASGNVVIRRGQLTLTSDKASLDNENGDAVAEGRVTVKQEGQTLKGDHLLLNTETKKGEVTNGDLFVEEGNFHIRGDKLKKVGDADYSLDSGSFTTCDGDEPSWHFTADHLDVTLNEYATGTDAVFYVKDIPLFYFPYLVFPVKTERQSGFLFPKMGSSTKKGVFLDVPYYWAISPSQELTVDVDMQTRRGVGIGLDYLYLRPRGSDGHIQTYGIYDTDRSMFRGSIESKQREYISETVTVRADLSLASDRDYFKDFTVLPGVYNREFLDSSVSIAKRWDNSVATAELRSVQEFRFKNDIQRPDNGLTLQRLPTITYTLLGNRLGAAPVSLSLESSFVNFYRLDGQTGQRLAVHPALSASLPLPGGSVNLWGGYLQRFYEATNDAPGEGTRSSGLVDAGASMLSSFERVYSSGFWGAEKVKHSLVPEIGLRFVDQKNQEHLPFFDLDDRIQGETTVGWALSNYITGKFAGGGNVPQYRELIYLRLSQGYTLTGERRDLLTLTDPMHRLSDLRVEGRVSPTTWLTFATDSRIDTTDGTFSTVAVSAEAKDESDNRASISYHNSRDVVEYLEGRLGLNLVKPFVFTYTGRYSFDKPGFLDNHYIVEYKQQCWSVALSIRDRSGNPEFMVSFTLAGVGGTKPR